MDNQSITTSTLLQRLFKTSSIDRFIDRHENALEAVPLFCEYINKLCAEKDVSAESVLKKTDIERTYGHQLFRGIRKPTRDRVIQFGFGFEMDYDDMQKLLSIARKSPLYPKIKRDAIIIFALKNKYSVIDVQNALYDMGIPLLGEER